MSVVKTRPWRRTLTTVYTGGTEYKIINTTTKVLHHLGSLLSSELTGENY